MAGETQQGSGGRPVRPDETGPGVCRDAVRVGRCDAAGRGAAGRVAFARNFFRDMHRVSVHRLHPHRRHPVQRGPLAPFLGQARQSGDAPIRKHVHEDQMDDRRKQNRDTGQHQVMVFLPLMLSKTVRYHGLLFLSDASVTVCPDFTNGDSG